MHAKTMHNRAMNLLTGTSKSGSADTDRPALHVSTLRKSYSTVTAVDDISFTVGRGEIVGLLGPNGAGKTTTINMVLGVLEPSGGSVSIDGIDIAKERARALERTNFAAVYASAAREPDGRPRVCASSASCTASIRCRAESTHSSRNSI